MFVCIQRRRGKERKKKRERERELHVRRETRGIVHDKKRVGALVAGYKAEEVKGRHAKIFSHVPKGVGGVLHSEQLCT